MQHELPVEPFILSSETIEKREKGVRRVKQLFVECMS